MKAQSIPFADQYRDPRWQKKRLEILSRDGFKCCLCGRDDTQLHVHHTSYEKGRMIWEYPNGYYRTLCDPCHKKLHALKDITSESLGDFERVAIDGMINIKFKDIELILSAINDPTSAPRAVLVETFNSILAEVPGEE